MLRFLVLIAVVGLLAFAFTTPVDPESASPSHARAAGADADSKPSLLASLTSLARGDSKDAPKAKSRATTQIYWQYVENGKVKFAPRLDDVPEAWRSKAGKVALDGPPPDTPGAARIARERATAHVRLPSRRSAPHASGGGGGGGGDYPEVVIYTTRSCPHCRKALAHLDRLGVPYENKDVENDRDAEEEYMRKGKGRRGVPLIDVGGEILRGYSPKSLDKALERNS